MLQAVAIAWPRIEIPNDPIRRSFLPALQ